jgi:general secretion pathway protein B
MSSILKALEKVEESQSSRRNVGAGNLVRGRERRPAWVMPAGVLGGAAVAALVTFAAMGGFSSHGTAPVSQTAQTAAAEKSAPVVVAPLYPLVETPIVPPAEPVSVEPKKEPEQAVEVEAPIPKVSNHSPQTAARRSKAPVVAIPVVRPLPVPRQVPVARQVQTQPTPVQAAPVNTTPIPVAAPEVPPERARPEVRVTGIAWQKDSASSAAIVNGRSVQQGSMVEGYKVEQIFEDRVRFSGKSGSLEVPLGGGE